MKEAIPISVDPVGRIALIVAQQGQGFVTVRCASSELVLEIDLPIPKALGFLKALSEAIGHARAEQ